MTTHAVRHPLFARLYSRLVVPSIARQGGDDLRRAAPGRAEGHGGRGGRRATAPTSRTTPTRSTASSPSSPSPTCARRRPRHADERVELRDAVASELPVADGEADAVVFSLVLCSVDQAERAGRGASGAAPGRRAALPRARAGPRARRRPVGCSGCWTPTVWPRLFGGCHRRPRHGGRHRATPGSRSPSWSGSASPSTPAAPRRRRPRARRTRRESDRSETPRWPRPLAWLTAPCASSPLSNHPRSSPRVAHRQGPAHRRGQDPPPARSDRQGRQRHRGRLRRDDRRRAAAA